MQFKSILQAIGAIALFLITPGVASADWRKAESERFIVYSEGSEGALRQYVQKLETFDRILRYRSGLRLNEAPQRKLPIYLLGNRASLLTVNPRLGENVAGVYFAVEEDIFAVALRGQGESTMLHEYAHHFMLGSLYGAYPGWLVEGFAEYYGAAEIRGDTVELGTVEENTAYWLINGTWITLERLFSSRPFELKRSDSVAMYYAQSWLITHWFISDPTRRVQLNTYLDAIGRGVDSVEAMESATGMTMSAMRVALRRYTRESLVGEKITLRYQPIEITITELPESANDLLLFNQKLKIGVPEDQRAAVGQEAARLAARHGDDPLALLVAGHGGLHFGDKDAGERALTRLLELDPNHVEALQFMAGARLNEARDAEDAAEQRRLLREAQGFLARAYAVQGNDYRTLALMSEVRSSQPTYPTENDMLTLGLAFDRAPQLASIRLAYADGLRETGQLDEAIRILEPLANNPHGDGGASAAERMIESIRAGQVPSEEMEEAASESETSEGETQPPPVETPPT